MRNSVFILRFYHVRGCSNQTRSSGYRLERSRSRMRQVPFCFACTYVFFFSSCPLPRLSVNIPRRNNAFVQGPRVMQTRLHLLKARSWRARAPKYYVKMTLDEYTGLIGDTTHVTVILRDRDPRLLDSSDVRNTVSPPINRPSNPRTSLLRSLSP